MRVLRIFLVAALAIFPALIWGQMEKPAEWTVSSSKIDIKLNDEIELSFKAKVPENWYLYSNDFDPNLGPVQFEIEYDKNSGFVLIDKKAKPIKPKRKFDNIWGGEVSYFVGEALFKQKIKINDKTSSIKGTLIYQICTDIDGKCVLFEKDFELKFNYSGPGAKKSSKNPCDGIIYPNEEIEKTVSDSNEIKSTKEAAPIKTQTLMDKGGNCAPQVFETVKEESLFGFFLLAFLSGLAALLTPCVFPMIPMTVSFFIKNAKSRKESIKTGIIYGISIIGIYTLIGTLVSVIFGAEIANWLSTHWIPNLFFFIIFVVFAASFLGMFEIVLPSSLVNKIDAKADKGGLIGVFFMAFTLVLVSFSCTGPIVGTIIVQSTQGNFILPIIGMFGFSLAFALPFSFFAIFPQWLNTLPKSGGWLNSVKVVLGFVELALGLKFLSVADQTYHWGLLDREIYLAIWIILAFLLGLYLIGKIRFSHDSELSYVGVPRFMLAIVAFTFSLYMVPGLFGANLPGLAGYLPPMSTHDFNLPGMIEKASNKDNAPCGPAKYSDKLHLPHGLDGYFEYKQAIQCAREQKKPLFIDFTGHGCVNCRKMEEKVWAKPEILDRLKEDFIVVALYVDDRTPLEEKDWVVSKVDGKVKKTIGEVNADFQICNFNNNAQPFYVILDQDEKLLAAPVGTMDYDVTKFKEFLDAAKNEYKKRNTL